MEQDYLKRIYQVLKFSWIIFFGLFIIYILFLVLDLSEFQRDEGHGDYFFAEEVFLEDERLNPLSENFYGVLEFLGYNSFLILITLGVLILIFKVYIQMDKEDKAWRSSNDYGNKYYENLGGKLRLTKEEIDKVLWQRRHQKYIFPLFLLFAFIITIFLPILQAMYNFSFLSF